MAARCSSAEQSFQAATLPSSASNKEPMRRTFCYLLLLAATALAQKPAVVTTPEPAAPAAPSGAPHGEEAGLRPPAGAGGPCRSERRPPDPNRFRERAAGQGAARPHDPRA